MIKWILLIVLLPYLILFAIGAFLFSIVAWAYSLGKVPILFTKIK